MTPQAPTTPATITLADNKERVLRYSNAALKTIKAEFGVSILREGAGKLYETVDEEKLSRLLVLGLDHKFEGGQLGITEEEIDSLLDAQNAVPALQQVFVALGSSILKNALDIVRTAMERMEAEKAKAAEVKPPEPAEPTTTVM